MEKPDVVPLQLKNALKAGVLAKYVLFDSWYCIPELIHQLKNMNLHTMAMAKRGSKKYLCDGKRMNCKENIAANKKRRGRSRYLLSVAVQ